MATFRDSYPTQASATGGLPNPWLKCRALPKGPVAALAALHLTEPEWSGIRRLNDREWMQALQYCDRSHLTLWLRRAIPTEPMMTPAAMLAPACLHACWKSVNKR
jgi:hypothetical protein